MVMKHTKIAIIGVGNVGASTAFALLLSNNVSELILVDVCAQKCEGEVKDLSDMLAFTQASSVRSGTYTDACTADIVILCAGKPQCPGQPRTELLQENSKIISSICKELHNIKKDAIVIMVTNPLDSLTYLTQKLLPLEKKRIFGTGTWLETQRLRRFLAAQYNVSAQSIEAFMIGEHGDSAVAIVPEYLKISSEKQAALEHAVTQEVYKIIESKCAAYYGIAACVSDICSAIIHNQRRVLPLSVYHKEYDICISVPVILGENGIEGTVHLEFHGDEKSRFEDSVKIVQNQRTLLKI
jgi:L-lactate dehydrogenase